MVRRTFLLALFSVLAPLRHAAARRRDLGRLFRRFRDPNAARRLGERLVAGGLKRTTSDMVAGSLETRHQDDLQQCDVLIADGWVLSRSEAEACIELATTEVSDVAR